MTSIDLRIAAGLATVAAFIALSGCRPGEGMTPQGRPAPQGSTVTIVVIEDSTGDEWPVHEALNTWAGVIRATGAALTVEYGTCRAGVQCVRVEAGDYGEWADKLGHYQRFAGKGGTGRIRFNASYPLDARQRRAVACHELGHALGLQHNPSPGSCLYATIGDTPATTPDKADRDALALHWPASKGGGS